MIFEANDRARAYYINHEFKKLIQRCMRLFFFFQKKEAYETLMMHDYGFYKFEKYDNYLDAKEKGDLKGKNGPIFENRE